MEIINLDHLENKTKWFKTKMYFCLEGKQINEGMTWDFDLNLFFSYSIFSSHSTFYEYRTIWSFISNLFLMTFCPVSSLPHDCFSEPDWDR